MTKYAVRRKVTIQEKEYDEYDLKCPDCGSDMVLKWSPKFGGNVFYGCSTWDQTKCQGAHGAHQKDGEPLGIPADKRTKDARIRAHDAFDSLWQRWGMKRHDAYTWMRRALHISRDDAHIGRFTIEQCNQLVAAVQQYTTMQCNRLIELKERKERIGA